MNNLGLAKRIGSAFAAVTFLFTGVDLITLARFTRVHNQAQRVATGRGK